MGTRTRAAAALVAAATVAAIAVALLADHATVRLLAVGLVVCAPLEGLRPLRSRRIPRGTALVDLAHTTVTTSITAAVLVAATSLLGLLPQLAVSSRWFGTLPAPLALGLVVLAGDTGYYWTHRAMHRVPALWRFHRIHHSSEEMGWLAAARAHPVDQVLLHLGWLVPLQLLGARSGWFAVYATLLTLQTLLLHSNLDVRLRGLRAVVVTPEFHHWHHTAERDAIDRNFASQLALLDRLFGTCWLPDGRRVRRFGVDGPVAASFPGQLAQPLTDLLALARRRRRTPEPPPGPGPRGCIMSAWNRRSAHRHRAPRTTPRRFAPPGFAGRRSAS